VALASRERQCTSLSRSPAPQPRVSAHSAEQCDYLAAVPLIALPSRPSACSGYSERKRTENVEAEIHRVVLEQALESYNKDIVQVVDSDTMEQMEETVARTAKWVAEWSPS